MRTGLGWLWLILVPSVLAMEAEPRLRSNDIPDYRFPEYNAEPVPQQTTVSPAMIERSRSWLAQYLNRLSGNIDSFFVDTFFSEDITDDDVEGSRAKISLYTRRVLGDPVDYKFGISVKVVLPNTNERLNLLLDSEDEEVRESDPVESIENVDYVTALQYIIDESDAWKTNLDAGVRWGVPPDPFIRFRARRYAYLSEWELRATQSIYYFTQAGWGEDTRLRVDFPFNIEKLFRVNMKAGYQKNDGYFTLSYDAGLYHELSRTRALAFVAGAQGDSQNDATFYSYFAGVRYRQLVYSDWVYAEIAPEFLWDLEKDYETTPVLMFRLESVIAHD